MPIAFMFSMQGVTSARSRRRRPGFRGEPVALSLRTTARARPAGLGEQLRGRAEQLSVAPRTVRDRLHTASPKLPAEFPAERLQQRQLLRRRRAFGLEVGFLEMRMRALVGAVEHVRFVHSKSKQRSIARRRGRRGIADGAVSAIGLQGRRVLAGKLPLTTLPP